MPRTRRRARSARRRGADGIYPRLCDGNYLRISQDGSTYVWLGDPPGRLLVNAEASDAEPVSDRVAGPEKDLENDSRQLCIAEAALTARQAAQDDGKVQDRRAGLALEYCTSQNLPHLP